MALLPNQMTQGLVQGALDLRFNPNTIECQVDASQATPLVAGQLVAIVDSAGGIPKVVAASAVTIGAVHGVINYDGRASSFNAGDRVSCSMNKGNVVYLQATAAISRGAQVKGVIATPGGVVAGAAGDFVMGYAIDKATAAGQLLRVVLDLPNFRAM